MFDDDQVDVDDARLERLEQQHAAAASQDAVAAALDDRAGLARMHRERIDGVGGFQAALIDEASHVARALRQRSADRIVNEPTSAAQLALELRNRLVYLLQSPMDAVRPAARFVFRNDLETVRKVTSSGRTSPQRDAAPAEHRAAPPEHRAAPAATRADTRGNRAVTDRSPPGT